MYKLKLQGPSLSSQRMPSFSSILSFVLIAISCASLAEGAPSSSPDPATHRRRTFGRRAIEIESFYPKSTFKVSALYFDHLPINNLPYRCLQTFGTGDENTKITRSLSGRAGIEETTLLAFNGIQDASTLSFQSGYTSGDTEFGYIKQKHVS